jgi:hypothetical protein
MATLVLRFASIAPAFHHQIRKGAIRPPRNAHVPQKFLDMPARRDCVGRRIDPAA